MKFEESSFEKLVKLPKNTVCNNARLNLASHSVKCAFTNKELTAEEALKICTGYNGDCSSYINCDCSSHINCDSSSHINCDSSVKLEPSIQLEDESERELDFFDTSTYSQTDIHDVYSTMLSPWCENAPSEYSDFFHAAHSKNILLHKLNCLICALKMSNNSYAQNIEYFDSYDMEEASRNFLRNINIRLD